MSKEFELNGSLIREHLRTEGRKITWLSKSLGYSDAHVSKMLNHGLVPKKDTLDLLARLLGLASSDLLIPKN